MGILRLVRLPNVFTALADILMGYLFVHPSLTPVARFVSVALASCGLYMAGMVFNDVFDLEQDRRERPHRPLPSGTVRLAGAQVLGWGLFISGGALAWLAGLVPNARSESWWRTGVVGTALAICVLAYDALLKATFAGPVLLGFCRMLNVLLGMSAAAVGSGLWSSGFDASHLVVAAGLGTFISGVTWFARREAAESSRPVLIWGIAVMALGLTLLASFPQFGAFSTGARQLVLQPAWVWPLLVAMIGFTILRRCLVAAMAPSPPRIQTAVAQCLVSVIILDAAVCLAVRQPWGWSLLILSLVIPMLILARWMYLT
jgi:4-hydroxybenzoate polyprenyltransferase